jgi:tetratricopeptide (TPR) repeat protein
MSGEEKKRLAKRPAQDKETYQLYLKALYFSNRWSVENLKKATDYARKALDRDPTCAPAYAVLAIAYSMLGFYGFLPPGDAFPKAKSAAFKALELDERLPDAHATLAATLLLYYWDWEDSARECRRALELNGDSLVGLHSYSVYLMSQGRLQEASAACGRAVELDPITPAWNFVLGLCYFCLHQYQPAIEQFRKTLELDSTNINSQEFWTLSLVFQGRFEEAIAAGEKIDSFPGGAGPGKAILGYCYASAGRHREARACLDELTNHPDENPFSVYFGAMLCTVLQESDRAFELLNKLCDQRFGALFSIKGIPMFEPLHSDPRFAGLLRRMGLPE